MFFHSPATFFDELEGASVLLVPQRHPANRTDLDEAYGRYQAGSIAFRRDEDGLGAVALWRDRCLEGCALDPDRGRWADQTHLEELPGRFAGVRVLVHPGGGVAPWNASRCRIERDHGQPVVDGRPLLFYHYSGLRLYSGPRPAIAASAAVSAFERARGPAPLGWRALHYPIGGRERTLIWEPYIEAVSEATATIRRETSFSEVVSSSWWEGVRDHVLREGLLRPALWRLRRALNAGRRGVRRARRRLRSPAGSLQRVEWGLDRAVGRLDRARSRWGVE